MREGFMLPTSLAGTLILPSEADTREFIDRYVSERAWLVATDRQRITDAHKPIILRHIERNEMPEARYYKDRMREQLERALSIADRGREASVSRTLRPSWDRVWVAESVADAMTHARNLDPEFARMVDAANNA